MLTDGKNHLYSFLSNNVLASLVESLQTAQKAKEEAETVFLAKRVEVKEAQELYQNSYQTIKGEAALQLQQQKSTLKAVNEELHLLTHKLELLKQRNMELKKISFKMEQIQMESSLMATSFEVFYKRRDESRLKGTLQASVAILSHAKADLIPVQPNRNKLVFLGCFLAVTFSLMGAFILDAVDQTIKTRRDVENYLRSPVIFSIEDLKENKAAQSDRRFLYLVAVMLIGLFLLYFVKSLKNHAKLNPAISSTEKS
jgi:capsular polysaccharide biosynthesis protein